MGQSKSGYLFVGVTDPIEYVGSLAIKAMMTTFFEPGPAFCKQIIKTKSLLYKSFSRHPISMHNFPLMTRPLTAVFEYPSVGTLYLIKSILVFPFDVYQMSNFPPGFFKVSKSTLFSFFL